MTKRDGQLELFRVKGRNRNQHAVERTVGALRAQGRLEAVDAGILAAARTLARALDEAPNPYVAATVARVHLQALAFLSGRPAPERDELDEFVRSLRRPAPVRDET